MQINFNLEIARRIGSNEAILLHILIKRCSHGRLIKRRSINGHNKQDRMFERADNYRMDRQHLKNGYRYKSISINYLQYFLPWISRSTIRNVIKRLQKLNLIDVKHINLIVNDNTNCYAINEQTLQKLKSYCRDHKPNKPTADHRHIHSIYNYSRSSLDPNIKPMINDTGEVVGSISDFNKRRWIV